MLDDEIEQELRKALRHLYDPDFQPSKALGELLGCGPGQGALAIHSAIVQAIERLKPPEHTPTSSRVNQVYDLLYNRFVLQLTLQETADHMCVSFSTTCRAQRFAVHALARVFWEQHQARQIAEDRSEESATRSSAEEASRFQAADWRSQARRELALLQMSAPNAISGVSETIASVLKLGNALVSGRDAHLEVQSVQSGLAAAVHPSALRQTLIAAIGRVARHAAAGPITIFARLEDGNVRITITGAIAAGKRLTEGDLIQGIVLPDNARLEAHVNGDHAFLWVELPAVGRVTVLVLDDNSDMVRFYRRCTEKTSYHIVHTAEGGRLFEAIEATTPDVIVLDVMLPDADGWELLTHLHQGPATRSIPVIVCSVVREAELALSLGAAHYLPKPVRPRQFIQALDQVLAQARGRAPRSPANSVAPY